MELVMAEIFATDVLVCGAGAAGLTLAIDLARRGVSFRLIEKMDTPFRGSRGKGIQPRTLEIFEDLGIIAPIIAAGGPYPPQRSYRDDGEYTQSDSIVQEEPTPAEPYRMPLLVPQFATETVMRDRLLELGHQPEFGCALIGLDPDEQGVTARLATPSGEEWLRVRYLIGADGGHSFVRHALGIDFPGKTLGVRAIVADIGLTGLGRDAWHRFNDRTLDQQISLCPLSGTELFQLQAPIPFDAEIDLSVDGLQAFVAARTARRDIGVTSVSWASAFSMSARLADNYRRGRVFLVGDAAHVHPPTGGQGLNTSVQDAYNLGWKLAAVVAGAPDALLDNYEEERRPIAARMLGLATKLLDDAKKGEMRRGREVHQLDLAYRDSSLALELPSRSLGVCAGDRAPDALVYRSNGDRTRLFDLFQGPHWTLLGYSSSARPSFAPSNSVHVHNIAEDGDIIDTDGHFQNAYGLTPGDWVAVRPDGYVGAIVAAGLDQKLTAYLRNCGLCVGENTNG
jgi:2-polyprenyl-6-methoxyphenol hydroxylase-like FAD-dependent oxidoreductase